MRVFVMYAVKWAGKNVVYHFHSGYYEQDKISLLIEFHLRKEEETSMSTTKKQQ